MHNNGPQEEMHNHGGSGGDGGSGVKELGW